MTLALHRPPAVHAFDGVAWDFDGRFGAWRSVAAQRAAVRHELERAFPRGSHLLELGGGTGEDALHLAAGGRRVMLTDGAPEMIEMAALKIRAAALDDTIATRVLLIEDMQRFAEERLQRGDLPFDGAYSNFAAFNCVDDLASAARSLTSLIRPGGRLILVVFGAFSIGEVAVQLGRGKVRTAFRRLGRSAVPGSISGRHFEVHYASVREFARAFTPHFRVVGKQGIGVFVPPSAAEPAISKWPRTLRALEAMDRVAARPLWFLGDHVLIEMQRCP